ncbi:MAG: peptidoglycan endopeptidase [Clostridiales bacterium]|nr:peptidoglycan endopeptidase [Clostridiales bacterium]
MLDYREQNRRYIVKKSSVISMAFLAVGTIGMLTPAFVSQAEVLDDSNVGITYALDQYVASLNVKEIKEEDVTTEEEAPTCQYPEFEGKCLAYVEEAVNVRAEPDENSERVGSLPVHGIALVVEKGDTWTKIESGITMGYVRNDYLLFGDAAGAYAAETCPKVAKVNTTTLYVRAEQDENSECLTMIPEGESYEVIPRDDDVDGWTYIQVDSDIEGYVSSEYVDISYGFSHAISVAEEEEIRKQKEAEEQARLAEMTSTKRQEIVNYALQFVGNPYVYGGTSLTNGTDCSGFTMSVYAHFGYGLPRTAAAQMQGLSSVDLSSIQPGDLLFYRGRDGSIGHVTMYIGGGQVVHASSSTTGIIVSSVGYRTPCAAARIIWD